LKLVYLKSSKKLAVGVLKTEISRAGRPVHRPVHRPARAFVLFCNGYFITALFNKIVNKILSRSTGVSTGVLPEPVASRSTGVSTGAYKTWISGFSLKR